jgi:hypothetical protein
VQIVIAATALAMTSVLRQPQLDLTRGIDTQPDCAKPITTRPTAEAMERNLLITGQGWLSTPFVKGL